MTCLVALMPVTQDGWAFPLLMSAPVCVCVCVRVCACVRVYTVQVDESVLPLGTALHVVTAVAYLAANAPANMVSAAA